MKTLVFKIGLVLMRVLRSINLKLTAVPEAERGKFRRWLIEVVQNWGVRVNEIGEDLNEELAQIPNPVDVPGHVHVVNIVLVVLFLLLVAGTAVGGHYLFSEVREARSDIGIIHHDGQAIEAARAAFRERVEL